MGVADRNRFRRQRTVREVERVAGLVDRFIRGYDGGRQTSFRRHDRQLDRLEDILGRATTRLSDALEELERNEARLSLGDVAERCALLENQAASLYAAMDFYARRLGQRNESGGLVLDAADEVFWSCYRPVWPSTPPHPPPLTFFDAERSPWALAEGKELHAADNVAGRLQETRNVPLPLLAIPRSTANEPWSLALVPHEAGHHILHELELATHVADVVEDAACNAGSGARRERWKKWSEEIAADLYAVGAIGPYFVRALAELVQTGARGMVRTRDDYPSPVVRLAMSAYAVSKLARGATPDLADLSWPAIKKRLAGGDADVEPDLAVSTRIVDALVADDRLEKDRFWLPAIENLEALIAGSPRLDFGAEQSLERPRLLACALLDFWLDPARAIEDDDALRAETIDAHMSLVAESGDGQTRDAAAKSLGDDDDDMVDLLLSLKGAEDE
jgi:hypothetical protein